MRARGNLGAIGSGLQVSSLGEVEAQLAKLRLKPRTQLASGTARFPVNISGFCLCSEQKNKLLGRLLINKLNEN